MTQRVLILCTGNSARSQMAEGLWRKEAAGKWQVASAGSDPTGAVNPLAIQAMSEIGIDISSHTSQHLNQYLDEPFDVILTVCDNAAQDCPSFPGTAKRLHWPLADPSDVAGSAEQRLAAFRLTRDDLTARIRDYLASPG